MEVTNSIARVIAEQLFRPLALLPAVAGLAVASAAVALLLLFVFRAVSDQRKLARVKREVQAGLFELRLFRDDPLTILAVQRDLLAAQGRYLRLSFLPLLIALPILMPAAAQLRAYFGFAPLEPQEPMLVWASLDPGLAYTSRPAMQLRVPDGLRAEDAVWTPRLNTLTWVVGASRPGAYELRFGLDGQEHRKQLMVGPGVASRSPLRAQPSIVTQILYPVEPPLPQNGRVLRIEVAYRDAYVDVLGWRAHWSLVFLAVVLISTVLLARPLNVAI